MTIYRSRGMRGLVVGALLGASVLVSGCAVYKHSPFEVIHYKDTNGNGRYDSADVESHDVLTDRKTGAKSVIKLGEETRKMTREEIERKYPLYPSDTRIFE